MKIFCLLVTGTRNGEVYNPRIPIVSNDIKKVQETLKGFANAAKNELDDNWVIETDEEGWFKAYERNNYLENHVVALIFDKNLDELDWSD